MDETVQKYTTRKGFFKQYKKKSRLQETWNRFLRNRLAVIGLCIFVFIMLAAVAAPLIVMVIIDTAAAAHPVFGVAVSINVTTPVSPAPGVYVGASVEAFVNAPVPDVVQRIVK